MLSGITLRSFAQPQNKFFAPVEKDMLIKMKASGTAVADNSTWLFRPAVQISAMQLYYNKETKALDASTFQSMGVGICYQHFIQANGAPVSNYGFSALLLFDGSGSSTGMSPAITMSALQFFNFGAGYNIAVQKVFFLTGITYSFN
jgi:hypothetical protein